MASVAHPDLVRAMFFLSLKLFTHMTFQAQVREVLDKHFSCFRCMRLMAARTEPRINGLMDELASRIGLLVMALETEGWL